MSTGHSKSMLWSRSSTPIFGRVSAGSSSANLVEVASPTSVKDMGDEILRMLQGILQEHKPITAEALATSLQSRLAIFTSSLEHHQETDKSMQGDLGRITTTLQEIRIALLAKTTPRKRDKTKAWFKDHFGTDSATEGPDPYVTWRTQVEEAFRAFEPKPAVSPPITPPPAAQLHSSDPVSTHQVEGPTDPIPQTSKRTARYHTALDATEKALQLTLAAAEAIPAPAGGIVKAIAAGILNIITTLKGIESNNEDATMLAEHLGGLFQTIVQFLRDGGESIRKVTRDQLELFQAEIEIVKKELKSLGDQGKAKKAVSQVRNKETLTGCNTRINQAFARLQAYLSLDAVRILTRLEVARLLDLLGDLDTGAKDKADDEADLVCLPGTRAELLEEVRLWIAGAKSERVLWINGVAGCGKSAVSATIASQEDGLSASAIFHFSRGNQGRNDRVIRCLARQLARWNHGALEPLILAAIQKNPDIGSSHFAAQFQQLIVEPLKKMDLGALPVLIIIDALDEWDKHDRAAKLIDLIHQRDGDLPPSVKFVLTSRKVSHLNTAFDDPRVDDIVRHHALDTSPRKLVDRDIKKYLTKQFSDIRSSSRELAGSNWPGDDVIKDLVVLSGGLFQWASTAVQYVKARRHKVRLAEIRAKPNQLGDLDKLYQHILQSIFHGSTGSKTLRLLQDVLGFIVVAPIPITLNTIVYLLVDDKAETQDTLEEVRDEILAMLGAFLIIPTDPNKPIRVLHISITDFLTDPQRCTDLQFYVERALRNQTTATLCLRRMCRDLKRDICGINDPTKFNADIQDAVVKHVPEPLRYVCRHWAHHLAVSSEVAPRELAELVDHFCNKLVLWWIEVICLTGTVHQAVASMRAAEEWARKTPPDSIAPNVRQLLHETRRFLLAYSDPISTNVQHIYISAIAFTPSETLFGRIYRESAIPGLRVLLGPVDKHWPASLWVGARHSGPVSCAAFSSDGKTIVSGSRDYTLRLWDVEAGVARGDALKGHSSSVNCVVFSSDGKTVVSGSDDETLRLWDVEAGVQRGDPLEGHSGGVNCVAFSSDGKTVVYGSWDKTLRLWDVEAGVHRGDALEGHSKGVNCVAFSLDGKTVVSGSYDKTLRLWDVEAGVQRGDPLEGHSNIVNCVAFSSDGKTVVSGSDDETLRLWDVEAGVQRGDALEGHSGGVDCVAFSLDGKTVVSGSNDTTLRLWDVEAGVSRGDALEGHSDSVSCVAFSSDGKTVVSGSDDMTLRLWDVKMRVQRGNSFHTGLWIMSLELSADDQQLKVTGQPPGSSEVHHQQWDLATGLRIPDSQLASNLIQGPTISLPRVELKLSRDGWVRYGDQRWFWLPASFGRNITGSLLGKRFVFKHDRHVCIIDVSGIIHLVCSVL